MRYIGNKRRLLDYIGDVVAECGLRSGTAFDAFAGTASVGRELKRRGFAVTSCDLMTYSYVFQRAYIELDERPGFDALLEREPALRAACSRKADRMNAVLRFLDREIEPRTGFITTHYSPDADDPDNEGRMFFTPANARRIDGIRLALHEWLAAGALSSGEFHLLLATLLEGADAVANTTGVYAAYVKSWQPNALRDLRLREPDLVTGTGLACRAIKGDARAALEEVGPIDLLYLDPPYNSRQYRSYYHVPEVIARGWFDEPPEPRGKTGLISGPELSSAWSTRRGCVGALDEILAVADARWILLSYNSEGIIPDGEIERLFRAHGRAASYRVFDRDYGRYRADREHAGRRFLARRVRERIHVVEGRSRSRARRAAS